MLTSKLGKCNFAVQLICDVVLEKTVAIVSKGIVLLHNILCSASAEATTVPLILGKRRRRKVSVKPSKVVAWDREVVCLPHSYMKLFSTNGVMLIPRKKKDTLASFGLVGRLHLESDWSECEVVAEICSTFSDLTEDIQFQFLQFTGTGTKSLMIPKVSSSYKWTPKEVAERADRPIYLLLLADLKNEVKL